MCRNKGNLNNKGCIKQEEGHDTETAWKKIHLALLNKYSTFKKFVEETIIAPEHMYVTHSQTWFYCA